MPDFLLELLSEEIPARMQPAAAAQLRAKLEALLADAGLPAGRVEAHATPRRLAAMAWGVPAASAASREERRGPRADAPDQAVAGFLKSTGLSRDQLEIRDDPKGRFLYAVLERPGVSVADALSARLPALIEGFDWPKSMRWGEASASMSAPRWVRPLRAIVALLDDAVVPFTALGVTSGRETSGHRFMSSGLISIEHPATYVDQLRAAHVILSADERREIIRTRAQTLAHEAGLQLVPDGGLEAENAGLTEWPVPLLGRFDPAFLAVPPEVIQLTMRANQKYFALVRANPLPPGLGGTTRAASEGGSNADARADAGTLAPAFICVANIEGDPARIIAGNERVLSARLADARFFWDRDLATPLESLAPKLETIVFHAKLGTVADKVDRVAKLARWLAERIPGCDPDQAERAARLAKCDLVTGTVGEFPEVQGLAGGHLARAQGEPDAVADAIRDHYKPVGQGDNVPTAPVSVAVALADKLDTLAAFFRIGELPSGSRDPFALRRAALGIIQTVLEGLRLPLAGAVQAAGLAEPAPLLAFFADRLKVQQRDAGTRHDVIDAAFALGDDDLVRLLARVRAVQSLLETETGANLLAGYRRAANILKKEGYSQDGAVPANAGIQRVGPDGTDSPASGDPLSRLGGDGGSQKEPAEAALRDALAAADAPLDAALEAEDFGRAAAALASLRSPIDAFFDQVKVNADEPAVRARRLALLADVRAAMHRLADFSKIEG